MPDPYGAGHFTEKGNEFAATRLRHDSPWLARGSVRRARSSLE